MWHGYFVCERLNIGASNWAKLQAIFEGMGTHDSPMPAHNNHIRTRLDKDAVIYESTFDPTEVTGEAFKQLLADEFSVQVEDIEQTITSDSYAGLMTPVWTYSYNAIDRFIVRRFADGGTWSESGNECRGYLAANAAQWGGG